YQRYQTPPGNAKSEKDDNPIPASMDVPIDVWTERAVFCRGKPSAPNLDHAKRTHPIQREGNAAEQQQGGKDDSYRPRHKPPNMYYAAPPKTITHRSAE